MSETIFHINQDGTLDELRETSYDSEELLQRLLFDYPKLLAGDQINSNSPRSWILVSREFGIPDTESASNRWYVDHLFLDQDAIPTLVEVKRSTDTRIRREVIGQILDYAANAVMYWKVEELIARFETTCQLKGLDTFTEIQNLVGVDESSDEFWNRVDTNLKAGKIRLALVADVIPNEMKRIIEFLNGQMNPCEIIGIEIKQFVGENSKTLVPKVIGQTSIAQSAKSVKTLTKVSRDEAGFMQEMLEFCGPERVKIAQKILGWLKRSYNSIDLGSGTYGWGSLIPWSSRRFGDKKLGVMPFAIWVKGTIEIYFQHYKNRPTEYKLELMMRLNQIEGVNITENALNRRPSFDIFLLAKEESYNLFIDTFAWFYEQYEKDGTNSTIS